MRLALLFYLYRNLLKEMIGFIKILEINTTKSGFCIFKFTVIEVREIESTTL